ncbi:RnfABCDGE type electron transport complex subunit B [Orbaceae bacterium ESL0721]|nr:RnfABCDGE type electron transport complex subunit B [Orbaceae bacterium ESL0721]
MQQEIQMKAFIDEENCIGCGKCRRVCPTDAIIGSKQLMHTIIPAWCTACNNCINTCPTDCITLSTLGVKLSADEELQLTTKRDRRLMQSDTIVPPTILFQNAAPIAKQVDSINERKQSIADAIARVKAKKNLAK